MTGIEAISNAVPAFRPVEWRNARDHLDVDDRAAHHDVRRAVALIHFDGVVPTPGETVLSQLAHRSFGSGLLYGYMQATTAASCCSRPTPPTTTFRGCCPSGP